MSEKKPSKSKNLRKMFIEISQWKIYCEKKTFETLIHGRV